VGLGQNSVAVGANSFAGENSVSIGGETGQYWKPGEYLISNAIAIGYKAAGASQEPYSIILNATGDYLNSTTSGFFVKPLRTFSAAAAAAAGFCNVVYNPTTGEFAYTS